MRRSEAAMSGQRTARRILGIDPGSVKTGFGVIEVTGSQAIYVASGVIQAGTGAFAARLHTIFTGLTAVIAEHEATESAVEEVFVNRNVQSALKLGQARGAAICACAGGGLAVHEYSARAVKQALVGRGGADKSQVGYMVRATLGLQGTLREDAADALAVALAHTQHDRLDARIASGAAR
ncbi:MAG: crossover junction endodeoxyribonuclease RuvC [Spiribacter sp.]|nr:crossover junction endodeoxyribonuclease RuvC [Spiribacter sp.]MDR9454356.1 crossover junction endodeoxyribonuclease RuvC [Spiribacter sp.]